MRRAAIVAIMALGLTLAHGAASATTRPVPRPSPSASPSRGAGRTSPGVLLVFGLLAGAVLWQVQRGRRSAQDYARAATSHFERSLEPRPEPPAGAGDDDARDPRFKHDPPGK